MRKFADRQRTNREQTLREFKTEATLIPCGSWGGASQFLSSDGLALYALILCSTHYRYTHTPALAPELA